MAGRLAAIVAVNVAKSLFCVMGGCRRRAYGTAGLAGLRKCNLHPGSDAWCQLRTLLALCDLRAGAVFKLLAPSQMLEPPAAPV